MAVRVLPREVEAVHATGASIVPTTLAKRGAVPWQRWQHERADLAQLESWALGEVELRHRAGWAIVTGAVSGCIALDLDGASGKAILRRLGAEPHVRTPRGGWQVWIEHPGWPITSGGTVFGGESGVRGEAALSIFQGRSAKDGHVGHYRLLRDPAPYPWSVLPADLAALIEASSRPPDRVRAGAGSGGDPLRSVAAREYFAALTGRSPNRAGYVRCPFHASGAERTPSLKVYETTWCCYACPPQPGAGRSHLGGGVYVLAALLGGFPLPLRGEDFGAVRDVLWAHLVAAEVA